jgi:GNAT superfamily N-acetyltransferase
VIREATTEDSRAMAEIHVRAWRGAYRGIVAGQLLDDLSVDLREKSWRSVVAGEISPGFTLVAEDDDGSIAAFCSLALPSRDEGAGEQTAEITATYVNPPRWGEGLGRSLMEQVAKRLADGSWDDVTLWIFMRNAQGRAFYARCGFRLGGTRGVHEASGVTTTRMRLVLR